MDQVSFILENYDLQIQIQNNSFPNFTSFGFIWILLKDIISSVSWDLGGISWPHWIVCWSILAAHVVFTAVSHTIVGPGEMSNKFEPMTTGVHAAPLRGNILLYPSILPQQIRVHRADTRFAAFPPVFPQNTFFLPDFDFYCTFKYMLFSQLQNFHCIL